MPPRLLIFILIVLCGCDRPAPVVEGQILSVRTAVPGADSAQAQEGPWVALKCKFTNRTAQRLCLDTPDPCNDPTGPFTLENASRTVRLPLIVHQCKPIAVEPDSACYALLLVNHRALYAYLQTSPNALQEVRQFERACRVTYAPGGKTQPRAEAGCTLAQGFSCSYPQSRPVIGK